jgi:outer membrane biogenesis lipoprotein LolB
MFKEDIMKKLIPALALILFVSCASNTFVEKTESNHKNAWVEKSQTYRALSSVKEREKDSH